MREWLNSQVAGGYLAYHEESETYELPAEHVPVLARRGQPGVPRRPPSTSRRRCGSTRSARSRPSARAPASRGASTTGGSIAASPAFYRERLRRLARARMAARARRRRREARAGRARRRRRLRPRTLDRTDGGRRSSARASSASTPTRPRSRRRAPTPQAAGVAERVDFQRADAELIPGRGLRPDLLLRLPPRPRRPRRRRQARVRGARRRRDADGRRAATPATRSPTTSGPSAGCTTPASTALCVPHSRSEDVGLALGAQAGPARLAAVLREAGFTRPHRPRDAVQHRPRSTPLTTPLVGAPFATCPARPPIGRAGWP